MASIYVSRSLWAYKFRKLSYWLSACMAYARLYIRIRMQRFQQPVIGILLAEHLGDIVAAEPIIGELRLKHPKAKIVWIVKASFRSLLENHPQIDVVIDEHSILNSIWLTQHSPFNQFYNLHLSNLRFDSYFHRELINPKADQLDLTMHNYYHRGNLLKGVFDMCEIPYVESKQPHLYLGNDDSLQLPQNYWVIHRKSNGAEREWVDENWHTLIQRILDQYDVTLIEIGISDGLAIDHPKFISYVGKTSLVSMAKIIQGAKFFIGIDSGPTHIANAFEIPGLILLGDYKDFKNHMPYSGAYENGRAKIYHYPNGLSTEIPFETVWELLSQLKPIPTTQLA
ncbi:glycosyltransferase family 9 protein [Aquirufa sp. 5-AUSEE-100C1]